MEQQRLRAHRPRLLWAALAAFGLSMSSGVALVQEPAATGGRGLNSPSVQSGPYGQVYVRSVPRQSSGTDGTTRVFRVKADQDELLDEYPVYMRGDLHLGWSPIAGKWSLVQLEPAQTASHTDFRNIGGVSQLVFYMGGKELARYSRQDLGNIGLTDKVITLQYGIPGQFMVMGISQVPSTNDYVFLIRKVDNDRNIVDVAMDITTGRILSNVR